MIETLLLSAVLSASLRVVPEQSRPFVDSKQWNQIVAGVDGFEAYWTRTNELHNPIRNKLLRTSFALDGTQRGPTTIVRDDDPYTHPAMSAGPGSPLVYWRIYQDRRMVLASPLADNALKYPSGKFVAEWTDYLRITCGPAVCTALWEDSGAWHAAHLDRDANLLAGPSQLPEAEFLYGAATDEAGFVVIRGFGGDVRATRIGFDGAVMWDVLLLERNPQSFDHPRIALWNHGTHLAMAIVDRGAYSVEPTGSLRTVIINPEGELYDSGIAFSPGDGIGFESIALGWNGQRYLLAGTYRAERSLYLKSFALELDEGLRPVKTLELPPSLLYPAVIRASGDAFVIGWSGPKVTVYKDGKFSAPVTLLEEEAPPRRRSVGRH